MFSFMSKFQISYSITTIFFTCSSIELFPNNYDIGSLSEHSIDASYNLTIHTEVLVLFDNFGESISEPTTFSSKSHTSTSSYVSPQAPSLYHYSRVTQIPVHLHDYHCYFANISLYGPKTYKEASSNPPW